MTPPRGVRHNTERFADFRAPTWLAAPLHRRVASDMELVVLFGIAALLLFGPRRHGRRLSRLELIGGAWFLAWMLVAFGVAFRWKAIVGTFWQP